MCVCVCECVCVCVCVCVGRGGVWMYIYVSALETEKHIRTVALIKKFPLRFSTTLEVHLK